MELDPTETSRVWWKGAFKSALKGIPQGLLLGLGGAIMLGTILTFWPMGGVFNGMLFGGAATAGLSTFSPMPFIALNAVLTVVGNFLLGGQIAVNAYKQDFEHKENATRLDRLEGREIALEQSVRHARGVQKIIATGPRHRDSFAAAEAARDEEPTTHTIH